MRIIGDLVLAGFGQLKNARIENLATDPAMPQNGQVWFNTTDSVYRGFDGVSVITFASGGNTQLIIDALNQEIADRQAGDTALQTALTNETNARTSADTTLTNNLAQEVTDRTNADTALQTAIDNEATARGTADTALQTAIDNEATTRAGADTTLTNNLAQEVTDRTAADTALQTAIDNEATTRATADTNEAAARVAGDKAQADALAAEVTARTNADTSIRTDFAAADTSIRNDFAAADTALNSALTQAIADEATARAAADDLKVAKAGDSMTGNLAFGGNHTVTGLAAPTVASDAATKNYVDSLVSGLSWKMAVDVAVADHSGEAHVDGKRVLNLTDGKIYTSNGVEWNAGVAAVDADAVFDRATETGYVYSGTEWVQFTGTGQVAAGVGLAKNGNQIDVNLGAGIAQLPSDEVGVDVRATGGLFLTLDGIAASTNTAAQLSIKLADSSLTLGADGVKLSAGLQAEIAATTTALANEVTARTDADTAIRTDFAAADTALQTAITNETTARTSADTTLTNNLAQEVTDRTNADTALQTAITNEASTRSAADTTLTNALAQEVTDRTNADSSIRTDFAAADALLQTAIDNEATARNTADATLQTNIDNEVTARTEAVADEATARTNADDAMLARFNASQFLYVGSVAATSHEVVHNLGQKYGQVIVIDSNDKVILPDAITFVDANTLTVDFISAITCKVVFSAPKQ